MNDFPSQPRTESPALDDPRVVEALEEYVAAVEAGNRPNRAAFLAQHPDIADALAECLGGVEALQAHNSSAHESGGGTTASGFSPEWRPGTPLGDFRIIREIGRGGMGIVYEAEQLSLGRRIALKVLPFALTLDPRQLQRFKNEARAAAQLHHQHIVPIHFVGDERGVHFFAMQYVDGQSLAEVIQELRWLAGRRGDKETAVDQQTETRRQGDKETGRQGEDGQGDKETRRQGDNHQGGTAGSGSLSPCLLVSLSKRLSGEFFRSVAQLGVQAAEALEHAHEYGVVHRDIKPANILVDAHGHLWVADFGLAQFQSDAALTLTGDLLGTLRYMSPEQALAKRGVVDHRADIYSLGATLYELLTLEPAYAGRDRQELLRQIAFDEPRPPRRWEPAIPPDLETIVLKAMAKAVEDRYASARELADDLRSFLEHKPIRARRPSLLERGQKWVRRHQALVAMGVLLLAVTVVALAASTVLVFREQDKTKLAYESERQKAQEAEEQRLLADESFRQAREAVDFFAQLIAEDTAARRGPFPGPFQGVRRKALEAALAYYESFVAQRRDDPRVQAELVASRARIARLLSELSTLQGLGNFMLLHDPRVLDDLKVADERRGKLKDAMREFDDNRRSVYGPDSQLTPEQRHRAFVDLAVAHERKVTALLTPEQCQRLKEIDLQARGRMAFADPEVVQALGLTADQQERIRELQAKSFGGFREPFMAKGPPPRPDGRREREPPMRRDHEPPRHMVDDILKILTPAQQTQWKNLTGNPFAGPIHLGAPLRGGFRPGGEHSDR